MTPGYICVHQWCSESNSVPEYVYAAAIAGPVSDRGYRNSANGSLTVVAGRTTVLADPGWRSVGRAQIGTHPASVAESPRRRDRCLTWSPAKGRALQVCSAVAFRPNGPNLAPLLSVAELTRVALGLR